MYSNSIHANVKLLICLLRFHALINVLTRTKKNVKHSGLKN